MNEQTSLLWKLVQDAKSEVTSEQWHSDYQTLRQLPVNPHADQPAKNLLAYLYDLKGKRILSGQHEYLEDPYGKTSAVYNKTGKYPTVKGLEFGGITNQTEATLASQRQSITNAAIAWHNSGGIVTATYHATYPGDGNNWDRVKFTSTQAEFDLVVTPGTAQYNALIQDIDKIAVYLKQLRDAGVPVLWRPYHEMNGAWFWWGTKPNFSALWDIMFERYNEYHRLDNLLWVWSANVSNRYSDKASNYYVGDNRADILGMDIYSKDYAAEYYYELVNLSKGKPFAITENGELPSVNGLRLKQPDYAWFLTWGSYLTSNNSDATIKAVYADPYVLNRGQVYDPSVTFPPFTASGNGAWGSFYTGSTFGDANLKLSYAVPNINYDWYSSSTPTGSYTLSIIIGGYLKTAYSEPHTLYLTSSDGAQLYVNGTLVIDDMESHATRETSVTLDLEAGKFYYFKVMYYNNGDRDARLKLAWSSPSQPKQIIPQSAIYSGL